MKEVKLNLAKSAHTKKQSLITGNVNIYKQLLMTEIKKQTNPNVN